MRRAVCAHVNMGREQRHRQNAARTQRVQPFCGRGFDNACCSPTHLPHSSAPGTVVNCMPAAWQLAWPTELSWEPAGQLHLHGRAADRVLAHSRVGARVPVQPAAIRPPHLACCHRSQSNPTPASLTHLPQANTASLCFENWRGAAQAYRESVPAAQAQLQMMAGRVV